MATDPQFEFDRLFDQDYLYFFEDTLNPERNTADVDAVWKLLALQAGQSALELGCGHGRITNALAAKGAQVTGLDRAPHFIEQARKVAATLGVEANYILGDMREIKWDQAYDAVFLWYTTFGYFSEADNELVLKKAVRALKLGGRLLIEQINRNALFRDGLPVQHIIRRGNDLLIDLVDYDGLAERSMSERIIVQRGKVRSAKYSVRLYSFSELSHLVTTLGMQSPQAFGQCGEPYTLYGKRLITVAVTGVGVAWKQPAAPADEQTTGR